MPTTVAGLPNTNKRPSNVGGKKRRMTVIKKELTEKEENENITKGSGTEGTDTFS